MAERERGGLALGLGAFVLFFLLFVTALGPLSFEFPLEDMESSWVMASAYATVHHFAYGTQFVFTNGPLFPIYHRTYAGDLSLWYAFARLAIVIYLAYGFARMSVTSRPVGWVIVLATTVLLFPTGPFQANDGILLAVPLLAALMALANRGGWPALIVGIVLSAAVALGKSSFIPFCLGAFILVDLALLTSRRPPIATLLYVLSSWGLFVLAGQRWDAFIPFLVGTYEMTTAYSAALANDGPVLDLIAFLVFSGLAILILLIRTWRSVANGSESAVIGLLRICLALGVVAIGIKAGYVRADGHSVASWGFLVFLIVLLGYPQTTPNWRPWVAWVHLAVPLIGFALVAYYALVQHNYGFALWTAPNALVEQGRQAAAFVQSPQGWLDSLRAEDAKVAERIRAAQPLPPLKGSVDAISNVQASVIAAGLDFTPRPTLQENMTVSPPLIARNRAFLEGRNAPDHLIFAPGATDKRHPASIEGSLWPLLLSRYDIAGETSGGRLVLDKRGEPRDVELTAGAPQHATFGQEIAMPGGTTPLFLKLDIRETTVGKLVEQAYKPPLVYLTVSYASGKPETYRLIPGMIREGMVIAPTVATAADYEALASGKSDTLRFPTSIRIDTPGRWAYDPEIDVTFETIAIAAN